MLATSWPWPYAPEGVPVLTKPMIRADPGDHFDGVGWDSLGFTEQSSVENQYMMWGRAEVFAERAVDSGIGDNGNQILHSRIADRMGPYIELGHHSEGQWISERCPGARAKRKEQRAEG